MLATVLLLMRRVAYLTGLRLGYSILQIVHALLGSNSVGSSQHLDKGMSLVLVHNARLNPTKAVEDRSDLTLSAARAAYEECATKYPDMVAWQGLIPFDITRLTIYVSRRTWLSPLCRRRTLAILITIITAASSLTATATTVVAIGAARATINSCVGIVSSIYRALPSIWW
jgi:hypothetical protein